MMNTLIPRRVLFGNPERTMLSLSHDAKNLLFLAPVNGVQNVWIAPVENPSAARAITTATGRGIPFATWLYSNEHIIYVQDRAGDENWRLYSVNIATLEERDLTPIEGVRAQPEGFSERFPDEILVGLNDRVPQLHDLYIINIRTGERRLLLENDMNFVSFVCDHDYQPRFGLRINANGSTDVFQRIENTWQAFSSIPFDDSLTTQLIGLDGSGQVLYFADSRGRNTSALFSHHLETGTVTLLAEDARADFSWSAQHPTDHTIQAASFNYDREIWQVLDDRIKPDFEYLSSVIKGDINPVSRSLDDQFWIVTEKNDNAPVKYFLYDRAAKNAKFLFSDQPVLEQYTLATMQSKLIPTRDGLEMVCYLTEPHDSIKPVPMVLLVHGGPWARDAWGYDAQAQWLANRGYAVLQVNFRASTGFGKAFTNAGNLEWGQKMHDDLLDAVDWALKGGITKIDTVAIMGGSYGGYATLAALTLTPDRFVCGVDIVGPSNLQTLLESVPSYWEPMIAMLRNRMGDDTTQRGQALLKERSPLTHVSSIQKPLLIGQGANDPRVKQAESDQIVNAMTAKNIPVTYALFPDEGHGFARPENKQAFYAIAEAFLAKHLGGSCEAIGSDFEGSSIQILQGVADIPGAAEALEAPKLEASFSGA
jgi:dipeptidyl aminopeptidase/acylaminoacyl peptidase